MIQSVRTYQSNNNILSFSGEKPAEKQLKPRIFLAMPMPDQPDKQRYDNWNAINTTIMELAEEKGAEAGRIDEISRKNMSTRDNSNIDVNIMREIDNSDIVIADVSERTPNVYFELGYARGRGKKILPLAQRDSEGRFPKLPFDTRNIGTAAYNNFSNGLENSQQSLRAELEPLLDSTVKDFKRNHKAEEKEIIRGFGKLTKRPLLGKEKEKFNIFVQQLSFEDKARFLDFLSATELVDEARGKAVKT